MFELINGFLAVLVKACQGENPINAVNQKSATSIWFHSGHYVEILDGKITIRNFERDVEVSAGFKPKAKLSVEFMEELKILLNENYGCEIPLEKSDKEQPITPITEEDNEWKEDKGAASQEQVSPVAKPKQWKPKRTKPASWK